MNRRTLLLAGIGALLVAVSACFGSFRRHDRDHRHDDHDDRHDDRDDRRDDRDDWRDRR